MADLDHLRAAIWPLFEGGEKRQAFFGIPNGDTLRWILPDDRKAVQAAMAGWRPYAWRSRLKFAALQALLVLRGPAGTPRLVALGEMAMAEQMPLMHAGGLVPVIYVGTPGPRRKAVCHLVDKQGSVVAILKLALEPEARASIEAEARMLQKLADELPALEAPRLTGFDPARGLSAQTVLAGRPVGRGFGEGHVEYLLAMRGAGMVDLASRAAALAQRLEPAGLPGLSPHGVRDWQAGMQGELPSVWQHGDFAPWNLRRSAKGIAAYDWEAGSDDGMPLWDIAHFYAIQAYLFGERAAPLEALSRNGAVSRYRRALGIDAAMTVRLFRYFCLAAALDAIDNDDPGYARFLADQFEAARAA